MVIQAIHDISEICAKKGITQAVLSPGSRCAPLTISFARNKNIKCWTFSDERSAAFQAIGMAQFTRKPTVLVCTSGSAAYNYAPAVAEAYFQQIPLIILTADRPTEWIDQLDGQTIRQNNIYGNHVKASYQLPDQYEAKETYWHINRVMNEAINCAEEFPAGPVHINVPLREPFYPDKEEETSYSSEIRIIDSHTARPKELPDELFDKIKDYSKILIVCGQGYKDDALITALNELGSSAAIVADVISNMQSVDSSLKHQDIFLNGVDAQVAENLQPELLITFGKSVISKHLKLFLRKYAPQAHWHIQENGYTADTFQSLSKIIRADGLQFFQGLCASLDSLSDDFTKQKRSNYAQAWSLLDKVTHEKLNISIEASPFGELKAIDFCIQRLPDKSVLHLANSMAVRYVNFIGLHGKSVEVFANRGTSGIDGSNSTAYGYSLLANEMVTLITGDLAFFYDRNAFWNNYNPNKLRIILINNHGGGIFKMIKGPSDQEELDEFFVTNQRCTARKLAEEYQYSYFLAQNDQELKQVLTSFYLPDDSPKILEIKTNPANDIELLAGLKKQIKND